jgi:hypothetical protein
MFLGLGRYKTGKQHMSTDSLFDNGLLRELRKAVEEATERLRKATEAMPVEREQAAERLSPEVVAAFEAGKKASETAFARIVEMANEPGLQLAQAPPSATFAFNQGSLESLKSLHRELVAAGRDTTIFCQVHYDFDDPTLPNLYYVSAADVFALKQSK